MKQILTAACTAILLGTALEVRSQDVIRETTISAPASEVVGTVTEYTPDGLVIRSETAAGPVRYVASKTTEYVDEDGNTVAAEVVRSGAPVTVRSVREGDRLIAKRIIVRRATVGTEVVPPVTVRKTTTTTTTTTKED